MMFEHYFSRAYTGDPFVLFAPAHLGAIGIVLGACVLLAMGLRSAQLTPRQQAIIRHGLALFALVNLVAWYLWEWSVGLSSLAFSLPIQICTGATILCPIMLWRRSYRLFEIIYFWGLAGATQALFTPDIGAFGFPHFVFIIFFTSHGSILLCVVFMLAAERYRPYWSSLGRVIPITLGFLGFAGLANALTGGNYMFVARKPPFPTLIDYLGPWPWYVLYLIAIGIVSFVIVYLPYALRDRAIAAQPRVRAPGDGGTNTAVRT
jgi:hypothetical integral membrane protein (TIGR02206 family)